MPSRIRSRRAANRHGHAPVFAALGDETRLRLLSKLCGGSSLSISQLTRGSKLTRQAITKHLRVLEAAGIVRSSERGRERLFEFRPQAMRGIRDYLDTVSNEWEQALPRLRPFVGSERRQAGRRR